MDSLIISGMKEEASRDRGWAIPLKFIDSSVNYNLKSIGYWTEGESAIENGMGGKDEY